MIRSASSLSLAWRVVFSYVAATALLLAVQSPALAQEWQDHVRGSWVRDGKPQDGDVTLIAPGGKTCQKGDPGVRGLCPQGDAWPLLTRSSATPYGS